MARHFVDTSALVKLYRDEPRADEVRVCIHPEDELVLSGITALEFASAFYGLVRQGVISEEAARARLAFFDDDLPKYQLTPLTGATLEHARALLDRFAVSEGLRPADAMQLASAEESRAVMLLDSFVTTDAVLARCAKARGFAVLPNNV